MACVYGSRLLLLKTINKTSRGQKGVFLMTFSFMDIERSAVEPPPPCVSAISSQFQYNYSHVCEFFKDRKASRHFTFVVFSVCWKSAVHFDFFFFKL